MTNYKAAIEEAERCLKPGGLLLFIEGDYTLYAEDQLSPAPLGSEETPDGSWFHRIFNGELILTKAMA